LLLVRHAWAGDRTEWKGDDRLRPLDERGLRQAQDLVAALERFTIDVILTSPYARCVQTVEPLAAVRGLDQLVVDETPKWKKGATFVLDADLRIVETIRV
jgi:8-oxo-dGTP diphosphatase